VLLPALEDRDIWAYFASLSFPREQQVRETLEALAEHDGPVGLAALETRVDLNRGRLETMLKVLDVDGAVRRVQGGWVATGQDWSYDADRYARVAEAREREQAAMLAYLETTECRMKYLREQLDDPGAEPCGRCDNCGGLTLSAAVSETAVQEAGQRLSRPGVPVNPRRMWPSALPTLGIQLKGKIADGAEEGRVVARLTDLGYGEQLRALFRPGTPDGPVPDPLARAVVALLQDWSPEVDAIVAVESATRPTLTGDLAAGLSRFLGVPVVGQWAIVDPDVPPGRGQANSAQRIAAIGRRASLQADIPAGARVLLVDDRVDTGWTMTLATQAIRKAGAAAVMPLALASQT
ncbi:RecQ family zinc-binding domain-containing protein, partial [Nocardioides sp.]|uniref:phosphoribosyltransferase n=1 Tax=Nocardioides sp. TaxID=35761 RepID=UPI001A229342